MDQRQLRGIVRTSVRLSRSRSWRALIVGLLALSFVACETPGGSPTGSAGPSTRPDALKVVTTTTVFADLVQNVGGPRVAATSILPPGVGPEDYEPRPDDAKTLTDASLVVSNGLGLDDFLNDVLASGTGGQVPHLSAWSIPKGEFDEGDEVALDAALREFAEELGVPAPDGPYAELGTFAYSSGKRVTVFVADGSGFEPPREGFGEFELEWPPRSGRTTSFPEVDRVEWMTPDAARERLVKGQRPALDVLEEHLAAAS